jgi:hypothetical protein
MRKALSLCVLLALALAVPAVSAAKRKPPPPPPPPPDSAADCTLFVEPAIDDYLVLATLNVGVRCATTKQRITVTADFTRDGADVPLIPYDMHVHEHERLRDRDRPVLVRQPSGPVPG